MDALPVPYDEQDTQETIERVFAGQAALEACRRRDLGALIRLLSKYGITQGVIATRTGIAQGRLSQYSTGKHIPMAAHTSQAVRSSRAANMNGSKTESPKGTNKRHLQADSTCITSSQLSRQRR